jgi:hypothetical protein
MHRSNGDRAGVDYAERVTISVTRHGGQSRAFFLLDRLEKDFDAPRFSTAKRSLLLQHVLLSFRVVTGVYRGRRGAVRQKRCRRKQASPQVLLAVVESDSGVWFNPGTRQ